MKFRYIILTLAVLAGFGCSKDDVDQTGRTHDGEYTEILVKPSLGAAWSESSSEAQTRAPGSVSDDAINSVIVFQFDGTDEGSLLVSPQSYVSNLTAPVAFANRGNTVQRAVFVANVHDPLYQWGMEVNISTYADLKRAIVDISGEGDLYSNGLMMVGEQTFKTNGEVTSTTVNMTRNVAKIMLSLSCTASNIVIDSVQLCNVPSSMEAFAATLGRGAVYPVEGKCHYIDYEVEKTLLPASDGTPELYNWYLPQNSQGVITGTTNPKLKNVYAPKTATYVRVAAHDTANDDAQVIYTFYPGANMINDFNLDPNNLYRISVTITGKDDAIVDSRIDDLSEMVNYAGKPANTYIVNPPKTSSRKYRFYPTQVDQFWGPRYENVADNMLKDDGPWEVRLLWQDEKGLVTTAAGDGNITLTKTTGVGINDCFEMNVPSTAKQGTFLLTIVRTDDPSETILWSWHFWVTDYDPEVSRIAKADNRFTYPVAGGEVHRYADNSTMEYSCWGNGGVYENSFIMDRYLGQRTLYHQKSATAKGAFYYQFGRKDPFPASITVWDINGTAVHTGDFVLNMKQQGGAGSGVGLATAVNNPMVFYYTPYSNESWHDDIGEGIDDTYFLWCDKNVKGVGDNLRHSTEKSIYDPCPYGWRIPADGNIWKDFQAGKTVINSNRPGLEWNQNGADGLYYWPQIEVNGNYPVGGRIFYPQIGVRSWSHVYTNAGSYRGAWTSHPSGTKQGRRSDWTETSFNAGASSTRALASGVRCVSYL